MISSVIRILSFFSKWLVELVRQPSLVLSLVIGPFFILLAFGVGVRTNEPPPRAIIVHPADEPDGERMLTAGSATHIEVVQETTDLDHARRELRAGRADIVVVSPPNPRLAIEEGRQSDLLVLTDEIDPIRNEFAAAYLRDQVSSLNEQAVRSMVQDAQASAAEIDLLLDEARRQDEGSPGRLLGLVDGEAEEMERSLTAFRSVPPEVMSSPIQLQIENVAPIRPTFIGFYAPAVLALLIQHLAITLGALSMARLRLLGVMELLQVSPVRPWEVVTGNYMAYGALCVLAGAALVVLLVYVLGMPVFGGYEPLILTMLLLIGAALGLGFVIAMISSTEQQAAQVTMLVLLASIFFSGLFVGLERIIWPAQAISSIIPATYAVRTLQDVMLRGILRNPMDLAILLVFAVVLFAVTMFLFRRECRPG